MQHLNQSEKFLGRISEANSVRQTLKRAQSEWVNPKNSLALFASSWKNLKTRHTYHKHCLGGKSGVIVGHPEVHVWVPSQVLQCFILVSPALPYLPQKFRPENHPNFKEIKQLWVAKLDLNLADLMCKKHWQHCSFLESVDRGTGRALADLGLALRQVQITGIAFVTASTSARQYQPCKDVAPFGAFGTGKTPSNCIARTLAKLLCPA